MSQVSEVLKGNFVEVGTLKKTKGFDGKLLLQFFKSLKASYDFKFVLLTIDGGNIPFKIKTLEIYDNKTGTISFEEVKTFEYAQELVGKKVLFEEKGIVDSLPNDLEVQVIGFKIVDENGDLIGSVKNIETDEFQSKLLVENTSQKTMTLPFHEEFVKKINHNDKVIHVELPKGYLALFFDEK